MSNNSIQSFITWNAPKNTIRNSITPIGSGYQTATPSNNSTQSFITWNAQKNTMSNSIMPQASNYKLSPIQLLGNAFMKYNIITQEDKTLYIYNPQLGYYENLSLSLNKLIRVNMPPEFSNKCSNQMDKELHTYFLAFAPEMPTYRPATPNLLNFKNGVLDLNTMHLYQHSPDYFFKSYINCDFSYYTNDTPNFDQFMSYATKDNAKLKQLLYEIMGYIISDIRNAKIFPMLYGPSNTGKSVFLSLLQEMVGSQFSTHMPLTEISGQFKTSNLAAAKLNVYPEVDSINKNDFALIKALTSGEKITSDVKFQPSITFENKAALIFATNQLNGFQNIVPQSAMWLRLVLVPFTHQVEHNQINYFLQDKLIQELPDIILKYAIPGLQVFLANGCKFSNPDYIEQLKMEQLYNNSIDYDFVQNCCRYTPNSDIFITVAEFNSFYQTYCNQKGKVPSSSHTIKSVLKCHFPDLIEKKKRLSSTETQNCYIGLQVEI